MVLQSSDYRTHIHTYMQTHTYTVQSHLWQDMRNQFPYVTATYRSEIIIKSNWCTLLNISVFDLGPNKFPLIHSLVTNTLEIWHSVLIEVLLFSQDFSKLFPYGKICTDRMLASSIWSVFRKDLSLCCSANQLYHCTDCAKRFKQAKETELLTTATFSAMILTLTIR